MTEFYNQKSNSSQYHRKTNFHIFYQKYGRFSQKKSNPERAADLKKQSDEKSKIQGTSCRYDQLTKRDHDPKKNDDQDIGHDCNA